MDFQQKLSEEVWYQTYKWETDNNVKDTFRRIAREVAKVEKIPSYWEEIYYKLLSNRDYVPGGRIISNAGTQLRGTSLVNCFVSGFEGENRDSIEGIYKELTRQAKILKSEGGYGFCVGVLRPQGAYISGIGSESPGPIKMLDLWDISSAVITSGSSKKKNKGKGKNKIRKGAMMCTMSCWNPSIEEFIVVKKTPGKLTKFNLSVLITDDFIHAVKNNLPWSLEFPESTHEKYDSEWDGNLKKWKEKKYPCKVYKTYPNANALWDLIMQSTYNKNEPGIIFIDRANFLNNTFYTGEVYDATNPCGEQLLEAQGACVLAAKNLINYINADKTDFDYEKLEEDIPIMVRFQDAINDVTNFPLPEQSEVAQRKRRIGIGYMGYGSALYLLKKAYGSPEAIALTDKLCSFVTNKIYQASSLLAKEKGSFPLYDEEKFLQSNFVKQALWDETIEMIKKNGLRNSHLTTCAPTGNSSILTQCVSGGLEPVISHKYVRTVSVPYAPEGLELPKELDWDFETYKGNTWTWIKEGEESLLKTTFNDTIYKYDRNRGLTKEEEVYDYAVLNMGENFWKDKEKMGDEFYGKTIFDLNVDDHINTMAVFAKYIDSSLSKTINFPNDYPYDDFKNAYMKAYDSGYIKGVTTYRWGTMTSVVSTKEDDKEKDSKGRPVKVVINHAPKRPQSIPCDIHTTQIKGEKWYVVIGKLNDYPFEVFAGKKEFPLPEKGIIKKVKSKNYMLYCSGKEPINLIETFNENGSYIYSKMLAHGIPIWAIVDMCDKLLEQIFGFNKAMGRVLKKYLTEDAMEYMKCSECGGKIIFQEGCMICIDCGISKCS